MLFGHVFDLGVGHRGNGALDDRETEQHLWVKDPVCSMRVDEWTAVNSVQYKGDKYVFCTHRCLERFQERPERYVAG